MRYDIYYILDKWAPNLSKSRVYQQMVRDIISDELTYEIREIDEDEMYIELYPEDQAKIIVVDSSEGKEKVEYSCIIKDRDSYDYQATVAISEGKDPESLVYSYIEMFFGEKLDYFQTTTFTFFEDSHLDTYDIQNIKIEKCCYDHEAGEKSTELKCKLNDLSARNEIFDYAETLREINREIKEQEYIIPDLKLSISAFPTDDAEQDLQLFVTGDIAGISFHNYKVASNVSLSQEFIAEEVAMLYDFLGSTYEDWRDKIDEVLTIENSLLSKMNFSVDSFSIEKFIDKVSLEPQIIKRKY